ncbi:aminodeoxychorismate lyase [Thalassoporum mexicanum PCC 7367]|uniref:endolytic transglycosylase MltG n=1 Tax=Thalassoporum mexicanum TaxID=3457544 RepID=UPI00029FA616|nr:endolytic transglycosylase MltG [Pseudanabaena sp. PCC 7367]AFY68968.1 aminodeoxychorismate lyase [Pseudanabaena sp. PCC 7367]
MKISKWLFYGLALPVTLVATAWGSALWWKWASDAPNNSAAQVKITIPDGTPAQVIASELESAGVIRSALALRIWLRYLAIAEGESQPLQSGTYDLAMNAPLPVVVEQLQVGVSTEARFTIPEGWTIALMADYFEEAGLFPAADFIAATNAPNVAELRPWLPDDIPNLEGFLFPDTYQVDRNEVTPAQVIDLMLNRFEEVGLPLYQEAANANNAVTSQLNLREWVTLASIVEREAVLAQERSLIAGVFWQRLRNDIPLQADPTVEYALNIRQTPEQPLTLDQVRTPSPYNTYINSGIPPGAIASPGLASLEATLYPEATEYLYFVARYDGSHIFSRTLEEHEQAVQQIGDRIDQQIQEQRQSETNATPPAN